MYQALYRKWRPRGFDDIVGQEAITGALLCQINANRIGHAYLFTGTRGTGKTTCAKVLAKAVNCENPGSRGPCGECPCCLGIDNGTMLDVTEIDAASNNGVDDVRDLRDETVFRPGRCRYRVYIIDEVHMLSIQAFNALLKILEEPPSHVIFILATTEIHKVPATILSRCQRFDFLRIAQNIIKQRLLKIAEAEEISLEDDAAALVAVLGDGSMRDALSLLDTCAALGGIIDEERVRTMAGVTDKNHLFSLGEAVAKADVGAVVTQITALRERSIDIKRLCEELVAHYRNCLLAIVDSSGSLLDFLPEDEKERYLLCTKGQSEATCIRAVRRLAEALDKMGRSPNPRVELELAMFDIALLAQNTAVQTLPQKTVQSGEAPAMAERVEQVAVVQEQSTREQEQTTEHENGSQENEPLAERTNDNSPLPSFQELPVSAEEENEPAKQPEPFSLWPQVVEQIGKTDSMVYSFVKKTDAYFDGKRVLLDGGDVFLEFMRANTKVSEVIKAAIQTVSGTRYGIGPYLKKPKEQPLLETTRQTLAEWQEKGVPIEYEKKEDQKGDKI